MPNDVIVHVVDDDETFRKSLTFLLASAGYSVCAYESALTFLALLPLPEKACLVTDLRMPQINGIDLLLRLRALDIEIPTIIITCHGDVSMAVQAMKAGAADFIEKPFKDDVLIRAINRVASQGDPIATTAERNTVKARLRQLTEREQQVLAGVVEGLQNKAIAFDLGISARTVEVHRANMMAKMGAHNIADLVRMVLSYNGVARPRINP
ncbi:response regulator [Neorhizobium sp. T786]|uniref:response regulator FixJ n=1 Tax=Pseudorhizobium xiangyangii TaxID=2883104 RepID=UPI001CFFBB2C|nr:response regulator FixJ [Neorhizobium xiangyangii]MCB5204087.1 response regulator [Neorhizobium xiangyangii]